MFKKQPEFYRYNGGEEHVSGRKLEFAEWVLRNKFLMRKIVVWFLAIFCILTFGYGLFGWTKYLAWDYWRDRDNMREQVALFQDYASMHSVYGAADLRFGGIRIFRSAENKYDFVSVVTNPNERWLAKVRYKFTFSGGETGVTESVIIPGAQVPVGYFGLESSSFPSNPQMEIEHIEWKQMNPHSIVDVQNFIDSRTDFVFENFMFTRASQDQNQLPTNRIEFDLVNNSAYGYYAPMFLIELLSADQVVGYVPLILPEFRSGAGERIDIRTFLQLTSVNDAKLYPLINLLDESAYIAPGS